MALPCNDDISTKMSTAIKRGNLHEVRSYIDSYGLSYSSDWKDGYTLLCDALKFTRKEITKLLLANGCKVNPERLGASCTPLHMAVRIGDEEIVKMLLENGADVNAVFGEKKQSALHEAVTYNKVDMIKLLLNHGADFNLKDSCNNTPVDIATESGSVLLLRHAFQHDDDSLVQFLMRNA